METGKSKTKGTPFLIISIIVFCIVIAFLIFFGIFRVLNAGLFGRMVKGDDLVLSDFGAYAAPLIYDDRQVLAEYYIALTNPNDTEIAYLPQATIYFLSASGDTIETDMSRGAYILPGDTVYFFGSKTSRDQELLDYDDLQIKINITTFIGEDSIKEPIRSTDVELSDVSVERGETTDVVTGSVTNNSDYELKDPAVYVVFKSGDEVVLFEHDRIGNIAPGDTVDFKIPITHPHSEYDSFECYVDVWGQD